MSLTQTASASAPALRTGRIKVGDFYASLRERYETHLKFARLFAGTGVPASLSGPAVTPKGSLAGIPIAVSPDIDIAGLATHSGCDTLRAAFSSTDGVTLSALRSAGVHVLGQTTSAELGLSIAYATSGIAKNPYSNFGISGGSVAAAVSSRVATLGLCVDLVGGSRVAAALCGVAAFRPSHGRYNTAGTLALSPTLAALTLVARTVRDLQLTDAVITSHETKVAQRRKAAALEATAAVAAVAATPKDKAATLIQALGRGRLCRNITKANTTLVSTPRSLRESTAALHGASGLGRLAALKLGEGNALSGADGPGSPGSPTPLNFTSASSAPLTGGGGAGGNQQQFVARLDGLRIGVPRSSEFFANLSPAVATVIDAALSRLSKAGAILIDVDLNYIGSLGERESISRSAAAIADVLLAYEAPREIAAYAMSRNVPAPAAPKAEGSEEDVAEEDVAEEEEDGEPKAPAATIYVPLDSIVTAAKILGGFKGPAPQKALLTAQLNADTAVTSVDYRAALVYQRPALKRAFEDMFAQDHIDALVYPATLIPAISPRGAEGASVDFAGSVVVSHF